MTNHSNLYVTKLVKFLILKNYNSLSDKSISSFVNSKIFQEGIERNFNEKILHTKDERFKVARINSLEIKIKDDLEAVECLKRQE